MAKTFLLGLLLTAHQTLGFFTTNFDVAGLSALGDLGTGGKGGRRANVLLMLEPNDFRIEQRGPTTLDNESPTMAFRVQREQLSMPPPFKPEYISSFGSGPNLLLAEKSRLKASKLQEDPEKTDFLSSMAKARRLQFSQRGGIMAHNSMHKTIKEILMGIS